jgi:NRPS condensation-like uncharacterized protein
MIIHQEIPISLKLEYSGQYIGGLTDSKFNMKPLNGEIREQEIISVFEFASEITSGENDFILNAVVRIPFIIRDKKHIDTNDCIDIMKFAIKYLKTLINISVYPSLETIAIPEIEKDDLDDVMNTFLVEMNAIGKFGF